MRLAMLLLALLLAVGLTSCDKKDANDVKKADADDKKEEKTDGDKDDKSSEKDKDQDNPVVILDTSLGKIEIELFPRKSPITVKNFLRYVDDKFYDGTIFHRVIDDFMIQAGGFLPGMAAKEGRYPPILNESLNGLSNKRGTVAMARTNDPDSATAQYFITVKDTPGLDRANAPDRVGYCVFGKVIDGMDVVDQIKKVKTTRKGEHRDVPVDDVVVKTVRRKEKK